MVSLYWRREGLFVCCLLLPLLLCISGHSAEPPLPEGLAPSGTTTDEPPLPIGLDAASEAPAQPPGLAPVTSSDEPPLPIGLDAASEAPALPPGLAPATSSDEPPLPSGLDTASDGAGDTPETSAHTAPPFVLHGFWDQRAGARVVSDPAQSKDATLGEMRLQLKTDKDWHDLYFEFTGDGLFDAVDERARVDIRQLRVTWSPVEALDIRIGRQVLTWGTGDMLFINDLFPKDWVSYFSGRDVEYLKAPSNAARVGFFNNFMNVEVVYSPRFDPDRYITGRRFSYYSPLHGRTVGRDRKLKTDEPDNWFDDDEIALRLYRNLGSAQLAFYGYSGYWKSPGGMRLLPPEAVFPKLRVYGASLRGMVGRGVGTIEIGYFDSYEDRGGNNPFVNNSEFRALIGYEREIAAEFTAGVQYYLEHMMDYGQYKRSLPFFMTARDRDRHVFTLRLTKLLMNQNLILSLFTYYSPSDNDAYLRPNITYKISDHWTVEGGGNIFLGSNRASFFGQFQDNTNIYMGARFSF